MARALRELYDSGIRPDWWKLEPQASREAWGAIAEEIEAKDRWCRGVVLLGLEAPEAELERAFRATASVPMVRGFAVGRTIFADAARDWLAGAIDDGAAVDDMAGRFARLERLWEAARSSVSE
jgi:5-dehydro-2-deoxygluconokinase